MNENEKMSDGVVKALRWHRWTGRGLAGVALGLGLLAILASVLILWGNILKVFPMQRLLLQEYPQAAQQAAVDAEGKPNLSREELDFRHAQVTNAHGKLIFLTDISVALLAVGTVVILTLVIFNRRVTLRQINASLAQISEQIAQLKK
jgi:hypothetical protein